MGGFRTWPFVIFAVSILGACVSIDQKSQDALRIVSESGYLSKISSALDCGGLEITVTQSTDMSFRTMEVYFGSCAKIDTTLDFKFSPEIISANALYTLIRNSPGLPFDSNDVISVTVASSGTLISSKYTTERSFGQVSADLKAMDNLSGRLLCDIVKGEIYNGGVQSPLLIWNCEEAASSALSIGAPFGAFVRNSTSVFDTKVMLFDGSMKQVVALITDIESEMVYRAYLLPPDNISISTLESLDLGPAPSL